MEWFCIGVDKYRTLWACQAHRTVEKNEWILLYANKILPTCRGNEGKNVDYDKLI